MEINQKNGALCIRSFIFHDLSICLFDFSFENINKKLKRFASVISNNIYISFTYDFFEI